MDWILEPFRGPLFEAIGWALVNFLWQGMAVALILRIVLMALRGAQANTRYLVACAGLMVMAAVPVVGTFAAFRSSPPGAPEAAWTAPAETVARAEDPGFTPGPQLAAGPGAPAAERGGLSAWVERAEVQVQPWLPTLVLVWLVGVVLGAARLMGGWLHLRRLRTRWTCEVSPAWIELFERLVRDMAITRPVRLVGSTRIDVPAVAGALKPVVLIPASILSGLPMRDVELILTHELAHVRRHDYLVNLVQTAVETVLFFHPGVWWLSGLIRDERENCCDDAVVAGTGRGSAMPAPSSRPRNCGRPAPGCDSHPRWAGAHCTAASGAS